jgi:hypothetical protein
MKSHSSEAADGSLEVSLADRLLLRIAGELGPMLDRIDVDVDLRGLRIRDLLVEFVRDEGPWPTEVRLALIGLIERGLLARAERPGLFDPTAEVELTLQGLAAARVLQPGCGRPASCVTLRMRKKPLFGAWFDTGNKERDRGFDDAGLTLAAFYVVAVKQPSRQEPLLLHDCLPAFVRLALQGIGAKSGPGDRLVPSTESMGAAFERLRSILPLKGTTSPTDKRQSGWFLDGPFPEVRIEGATGPQFVDWVWMKYNLGCLLQGRGFPDRENNQAKVHSDHEVQALIDGRAAGPARESGSVPGEGDGGAAASVAGASGD